MTYSAALFDAAPIDCGPRPGSPAPAGGLAAAQRRKIDRLLDETGVGPGTRVLEIGTGWGELAIRARPRAPGAHGHHLGRAARPRPSADRRGGAGQPGQRGAAGLPAVRGQYDAILVGRDDRGRRERYWPDYFRRPGPAARPGGRVGLQAITMPHERMLATRRTQTWILKYIFPGGLIPSVTSIEDNVAAHTGLRVVGPAAASAALRADAAAVAGAVLRPARKNWRGSGSTRCSAGCGCCTCATPRRASARATWTSGSSCWQARPGRGGRRPGGRRPGGRRPGGRRGRRRGRSG